MGVDAWGFDEERQAVARRLRDRRFRLMVLRVAVYLGATLALLAGGAVALRAWAASFAPATWAHAALFLATLYGIGSVLGLPFSFVSGFVWERRAGLTDRGAGSWLRDYAKSAGLGFVAVLVAGEVLLWLLVHVPVWWWVVAWGLSVLASFVLGVLAPVLLVPLFLRSRPIADPQVKTRLESLARRAGVPVRGAYELAASAKTRRSNAAVMGYGATRRIVVTDTLLSEYTPREIDAVLAHELAHEKYRDPWTGFAVGAATSFAGGWLVALLYTGTASTFGLAGLADAAGLVVIAFYAGIVSVLTGPLGLAWSRRREARADRFSLDVTRDPHAQASAIVKLHDKNLGVAHPARWEIWLFYSHPPGRVRVEIARGGRTTP